MIIMMMMMIMIMLKYHAKQELNKSASKINPSTVTNRPAECYIQAAETNDNNNDTKNMSIAL